MSFGDLLKYSFLKIKREKKNIYFILVLSILSILLLAVLNYKTSFIRNLDRDFYTNPASRSLIVDPNEKELENHWDEDDYDYGFNKILELDHVVDIYYFPLDNNYEITSSFKNDKYDGKIGFLYGSKGMIPELTAGRKFDENETGVAICSNYFYPSSVFNPSFFANNSLLYENDLLNTSFEADVGVFEYDNGPKLVGTLKKNFKIVGLFDTLSAFGDLDVCYIPPKDMEEIYNVSLKNFNNPSYAKSFSYVIAIDDYVNMESVAEKIEKLGFEVKPQTVIDSEYVSKLKNICLLMVILIVFSMIVISILYVKKKLYKNLYETSISIVSGYSNYNVIMMNVVQTIILSVFSYVSALVIYKLLLFTIKTTFKENLLLVNIYSLFNDYGSNYVWCAVIVIFIPIIVSIIITKLHLNNQLVNLMRKE